MRKVSLSGKIFFFRCQGFKIMPENGLKGLNFLGGNLYFERENIIERFAMHFHTFKAITISNSIRIQKFKKQLLTLINKE